MKVYWKRLKEYPSGVIALGIIISLYLMAFFAPLIAPANPTAQNISQRLQPPSASHYFGTDELGRDVFSRIIFGLQTSLLVATTAVIITVSIGTIFGLISGYYGGLLDIIIMRLVDVILSFPTFFLILLVIAFLEPGLNKVIIVIGLTSWPGLARIIRAETLSLKQREFVLASRLLGQPDFLIIWRHILPNLIHLVLVSAVLNFGGAILTEAGLSFLGLGVQPPTPSWGNILTAGKDYIHFAWWLVIFPGFALLFLVLNFNLLAEALQRAFNPREVTQR